MSVLQELANQAVEKCKELVKKYGGQSVELAEVRRTYEMFHRCPDPCAFILLEKAIEAAEVKGSE